MTILDYSSKSEYQVFTEELLHRCVVLNTETGDIVIDHFGEYWKIGVNITILNRDTTSTADTSMGTFNGRKILWNSISRVVIVSEPFRLLDSKEELREFYNRFARAVQETHIDKHLQTIDKIPETITIK